MTAQDDGTGRRVERGPDGRRVDVEVAERLAALAVPGKVDRPDVDPAAAQRLDDARVAPGSVPGAVHELDGGGLAHAAIVPLADAFSAAEILL